MAVVFPEENELFEPLSHPDLEYKWDEYRSWPLELISWFVKTACVYSCALTTEVTHVSTDFVHIWDISLFKWYFETNGELSTQFKNQLYQFYINNSRLIAPTWWSIIRIEHEYNGKWSSLRTAVQVRLPVSIRNSHHKFNFFAKEIIKQILFRDSFGFSNIVHTAVSLRSLDLFQYFHSVNGTY